MRRQSTAIKGSQCTSLVNVCLMKALCPCSFTYVYNIKQRIIRSSLFAIIENKIITSFYFRGTNTEITVTSTFKDYNCKVTFERVTT